MGGLENREKWGLPDWCDPLPYAKKWSDDRWRWGFTRRRQDYRNDFDLEQSRNALLAKSLRKTDPNLIVADLGPNQAAVSVGLAKKYGFVTPRLPNPRLSDHPNQDIAFDDHSLRIYYFGPNISDRIPVPKGTMAVVLDLAKPWGKSQRDKIEASFKEAQERWTEQTGSPIAGKRAHKKTWPTYLRVLDGRECGASWGDIARAGLAEDASKARAAWEAANHLMFNWPPSAEYT